MKRSMKRDSWDDSVKMERTNDLGTESKGLEFKQRVCSAMVQGQLCDLGQGIELF